MKSSDNRDVLTVISGFAVLLFTPYIADILGRRMGTAIGCVLVIVGSIIQALPQASNPDAMFLAGRFIMGMYVPTLLAACAGG